MRFDVRWVTALLVVAGCSQPIETIDSGPGPDTQVDDTDDDTNDDTNDDTDDDTDTGHPIDTEPGFCDLTLSSPSPGTAGEGGQCVSEIIQCGDTIEASNEFGSTHYNKEIYESYFCSATENSGADFDAPERVFWFAQQPQTRATVTLETDCSSQLKLRTMKFAYGNSCVSQGDTTITCDRNYGAGFGEPQVVILDAATNQGFYDIIVDGRNGTIANFKLTVDCETP